MSTSKTTIGIGVIGAGGRIRNLLHRAIRSSDRVKITAVCDPLAVAVSELNAMCPSPPKAYESARELAESPEVDWVVIGSWNSLHKEHALAALEAGKHVFCEKPLAITLDEVLELQRAWVRSGCRFFVGFTLRYSPHFRRLKQLIDDGEVGRIVSVEANELLRPSHGGHIMSDWRRLRSQSGGHLLEKCCHDIDVLNWLIGSRVSRIASFGGRDIFRAENAYLVDLAGKAENGRPLYTSWSQPHYTDPFSGDQDVNDNQSVLMQYENGVRVTFHTNIHCGIQERRVLICGTEGTIRADVIPGRIEVARNTDTPTVERHDAGVDGNHGGGDDDLVDALLRSMFEGEQPASGLPAGAASAITCFAADHAAENNQVVELASWWAQLDEAVAAVPPAGALS